MRLDDRNINLAYSPAIVGWDANFMARTSGAADPTVDGSNNLVINANGFHTKTFQRYAALEMSVTIPSAPVAGHTRRFGFANPNMGNRGRIEFQIDDDVFTTVAYDNEGTLIDSKVITWDSDWTNANIVLKIIWTQSGIRFYVGTIDTGVVTFVEVFKCASQGHDVNTRPPKLPMPVHVSSNVAESMLLTYFTLIDTQSLD